MCERIKVPEEPAQDPWAEWLLSRRHGGDPNKYEAEVESLYPLRDRVLENAKIVEGDIVLDVGAGDGLIAFGAFDHVGKTGTVIFSDISPYLLDFCRSVAQRRGVLPQCRFLLASADDLSEIEDASLDVVTVRSVLIYVEAKQKAFQEFHRVLKPDGRLSLFEPINKFSNAWPPHSLWGYDVTPVQEIAGKIRQVYEAMQSLETRPMLDFDERDLFDMAERAGFTEALIKYEAGIGPRSPGDWDTWIRSAGNPRIPTIEEAMSQVLTLEEAERFTAHLRPLVESGQGQAKGAGVFLQAVKHE